MTRQEETSVGCQMTATFPVSAYLLKNFICYCKCELEYGWIHVKQFMECSMTRVLSSSVLCSVTTWLHPVVQLTADIVTGAPTAAANRPTDAASFCRAAVA